MVFLLVYYRSVIRNLQKEDGMLISMVKSMKGLELMMYLKLMVIYLMLIKMELIVGIQLY
jgi:hypothetical protein